MTSPGSVPLNDLGRAVGAHRAALDAAVSRVLDSGWFLLGPELEAFEVEFAASVGVGHCVGVANGTDALELALRALDVGPGDEVVTAANAGMYTTTACLAVGATPVFADVDDDTLTLSAASVERMLGDATRAVVVTHLYGLAAPVDGLFDVLSPRGVPLVEDCAQAHGARRGGVAAGARGRLATFSFYPTKNLGALGDAGAVVTSDPDLDARLRRLRQYGWSAKYTSVPPGGRNSRLDELQAAVLRARLPLLHEENRRRRSIAATYAEASGATFRMVHAGLRETVAHLCVARHADRNAVRAVLDATGIATAIHYPVLDSEQASLVGRPWRSDALDVSERARDEILTLPNFPQMTDAEVARVAEALSQCR